MMEALWRASLLAANLWATGGLDSILNSEQGAVTSYTLGDLLGVTDGPRNYLAGAAIGGAAGAAVGAEAGTQDNRVQAQAIAAANAQAFRPMDLKKSDVEPPSGRYATPEYPKQAFSPLVDSVRDAKSGKNCGDLPRTADQGEEPPADEGDYRTPILPPIKHGEQNDCVHPPSLGDVLRAFPGCVHGDGYVEFVAEKLVDQVDPPRFFPLIGPAQLHHCHWKCMVYFTETVEATFPFSLTANQRRAEVVFIDTDHLHLFAAEQTDAAPEPAERCPYCPGGHYGPTKGASADNPRGRMEEMLIDSENLRQNPEESRRVNSADILLIEPIRLVAKKPLSEDSLKNICGEHLIRPDGTLSLGMYGPANVAGLTVDQVKRVIEDHLKPYFVDPQVSVKLKASNSGKIYIIMEASGNGQQVTVLPATGNESVLDALAQLKPLPTMTQAKIWVARPVKDGQGDSKIMPVDWKAITQSGQTATNYALLPGDRLYVVWGAKVAQTGTTEESTAPPRIPQVAPTPPQVQFDIIVAEVDPADFRQRAMKTGILSDAADFQIFLQQMRANGKVKMVAQPRVTTWLGHEAWTQSGSDVELKLPAGVGMPPRICRMFVGAEIKFLAKLKDGKIELAVHGSLSDPDEAPSGAAGGFDAPGFNVRSLDANAVLNDGQTLLMVADDFPPAQPTKKATLFLVTPRLISPIPQTDNIEAISAPPPSKQMSLADIVRLSKRGIAEDIIVRQMELTESVFKLTVEDILSLNEQGVSDNLIRAMQNRVPMEKPSPAHLTPYRIHGGVGAASSAID